MAVKATRFFVHCPRHGTAPGGSFGGVAGYREVAVSAHKRGRKAGRHAGCPHCKKEQREAIAEGQNQ